MRGYSIVFIPFSWAFGAWHRPHKSIYSFGPFRFVVHGALGPWRPNAVQPFKPSVEKGVWLHGYSPSEQTASGELAGGALEPEPDDREKALNARLLVELRNPNIVPKRRAFRAFRDGIQ